MKYTLAGNGGADATVVYNAVSPVSAAFGDITAQLLNLSSGDSKVFAQPTTRRSVGGQQQSALLAKDCVAVKLEQMALPGAYRSYVTLHSTVKSRPCDSEQEVDGVGR